MNSLSFLLKKERFLFFILFISSVTLSQVFIPFGFFHGKGVQISSMANLEGPQGVTVASFATITNSKILACTSTYLSASSSNVGVVPVVNITFSGTWPNCLISMFSPVSSGSSTITVTVKNEYNHQASTSSIFTAFARPVMAFSFRKVLKNYLGSAMRVRRISDNVEQDIGFDGNGNFDLTSYNTFVGASSATVRTWYDQSGNNYHGTQTTNANQPSITLTGFNGAPQVNFGTSTTSPAYWLVTTATQNVITLNRDLTVFFASKATTLMQNNYGSWSPANGGSDRVSIHLNWSDNIIYWDAPGVCCPTRVTYENTANVGIPKVYVFGRNNTTQYIKINGTTVASRTDATGTYASPTTPWYIGSALAEASGTAPLAEYMQFATGLTDAQVNSITNEQKNYFGL